MWAYYNENDPEAAEWLRELIAQGLIEEGEVDERSIEDVTASDIMSFTQCHFFAGIGIWSHALRTAGWAYDRPVWTASCPCQPFSQAGKKAGFDDERNLWPALYWLVRQCAPPVLFGEQVASRHAMAWIDAVQLDMEDMDYAFGAVPFPAASVGAPNRRDRLYWVANAAGGQERRVWEREESKTSAPRGRGTAYQNYPWADVAWLECDDGKARPIEPGLHPLAHGNSERLGRLRAYGNSLNAVAATEFIGAFMDAIDDIDALDAFEDAASVYAF